MAPLALEGRVAVVTGGGVNIGRATALRLAEAGARVCLSGRRREPLEETAAAIAARGGEALAVPADVTDAAAMEGIARHVLERWGAIDSLVALAGGGGSDEAVDAVDPAWWDAVVRVNLVGTFHAVRAVVPAMRAAGHGTIVTCAGGGALFGVEGARVSAYATAKAGLCRLTEQLALELADAGIRVNCLLPGMTWSQETLAAVAAEEERTGVPHPARPHNRPPEEAAELALWLASEESAPLTGRIVASTEDWWRDRGRVEAAAADLHAYRLRRREPAHA